MSKVLVFNGKKYLPSSTLASEYGYSADYISKLAREEKILGTQIGRQWFVEPESLKVLVAHIAAEKKYRAESLRSQRKKERLKNETLIKVQQFEGTTRYAFIESIAVSMCLAFMCFLGWVVADSDVQKSDLVAGTHFAANTFLEGIHPSELFTYLFFQTDSTSMQSSAQVSAFTQEELTGSFTTFPISTTDQDHISDRFSDEVTVEQIDGETYVTPIFKDTSKAESVKITEDIAP